MPGRHRFDQHNPAFFLGHRVMHDAARHDMHGSFRQLDRLPSFILNPQTPAYDVEQFVFSSVVVPDELAPDLGNFHILIIYLRYDLG
ncbi:hypothetical protein AWB69_04425 [Caballeronia udeis]|uniref:Uncharacterized protein n=1 Tax=Caballeronia udeis TaxID=1232866 RepID=A0A158HJ54_9BURK|nr:hypothetical protein AWB69_04425 [Caballeronia udeis]